MSRWSLSLCLALFCLQACSAPKLKKEPWHYMSKGHQSLGTNLARGFYQAEVEIEGKSGALAGMTGKDTTDLNNLYGGNLRYEYFWRDDWTIGISGSYTRVDPDPLSPLSAELRGDPFDVFRFTLNSRYFFSPWGDSQRWRPYFGGAVTFIPGITTDLTVDYGGGNTEQITSEGSNFWVGGISTGMNFLITDKIVLELGAFYEFTLTPSKAENTLTIPGSGPAEIESETTTQLLTASIGITFLL